MTSQSDHIQLRARARNVNKENQDEDASMKTKEAEEREARINYTLDMVVHDLVSQGHLHPGKSYLLKTPEMREHIGKMCDRLHQRKKEEHGRTTPTYARRNNVPKPPAAAVPKNPSNTASDKSQNLSKEFIVIPKKEKLNARTKDGLKPLSSSLANLPGSSNQSHQKPDLSKRVEPWITPRDIGDDKKRRPVMPKGDNRNNSALKNKGKVIPKVSGPEPSIGNELPAQAFRAKVDISGFDNDEISLELEGRKLLISANRAKKGGHNARKLTEVIEIPEGVNLENLKMGRRLDGSLLIEEFIPGLD